MTPSASCAAAILGPGWRSAQPRNSSGLRANAAHTKYVNTIANSTAPSATGRRGSMCNAVAICCGSNSSDTLASVASPSIEVTEQNADTVATSIAVSPLAPYTRSRTAAAVNPASARLWPNAYATKAASSVRP